MNRAQLSGIFFKFRTNFLQKREKMTKKKKSFSKREKLYVFILKYDNT